MKKIYVYDLETYPNFFLFSFWDIETGKVYNFEISDRKNEFNELKKFLNGPIKYLVGFNNLNFDYPILHRGILTRYSSPSLQELYAITEDVIRTKYPAIRGYQVKIPQIDLFKIWHYDNLNKATSLKWIEFALRLKSIEDLPYKPGMVLSDPEKDHIISYCANDLHATDEFLSKSIKHITLRKAYSKLESLDLMNSSEIHITKQIMLKKLSKAALMDPWILNKQRSIRRRVDIAEVIFPYIQFNDPDNQRTLEEFKSRVWTYDVDQEKALSSIAFTTRYKNVVREYAEGGLHSFGKPGIYESNDEYVLVDVDFASYYPHITFKNHLHPEHIDEAVFNQVYEGFYTERKKYPKSDPRNYVLKIVLNGTYGLSKDKYSFLYDPKWQLAVTVNGQLLLTLLTEKIMEYTSEDTRIIFENTDGAMYRIRRSDMEALEKACKEVEKICKIPLETQVCKRIIARDVNNYINIITDDNIKFKGAFEIDRDFHKNHSKRVVPIALANYYIHGVPVHITVNGHLDGKDYSFAKNHGIFDFCLGAKMKGQNKLYYRTQYGLNDSFSEQEMRDWVEENGFVPHDQAWSRVIDGEPDELGISLEEAFEKCMYESQYALDRKLSKITRYYVSNEGVELIKKLPPLEKQKVTYTEKHKLTVDANQMDLFDVIDDVKIDPRDRETNLEVGYKCTVFNTHLELPEKSYDINYDYYINECDKIKEKCGTY